MEHLNIIISENLKRFRTEKGLSLDKVAKITGVSKSMLGQIERGESNPTISTVWKIANGLKVSFTALLNQPQESTVIVTEMDVEPFVEDEGRIKNYPYFPFEEGRNFEIYRVVIEPGGYLKAEPHGTRAQEFVSAFSSDIVITVGDQEYCVRAGSTMRFTADQSHSYSNCTDKTVELSMVIYYPES